MRKSWKKRLRIWIESEKKVRKSRDESKKKSNSSIILSIQIIDETGEPDGNQGRFSIQIIIIFNPNENF